MSTADEWSRAYARQAKADLDTWERLQGLADGRLRIPAEHTFSNLTLLTAPVGRTFLKIIREAVAGLT